MTKSPFQSICVFCGSASGTDPEYAEAATEMGKQLSDLGIRTVYGGGHVGLMGTLADAVLDANGEIIGVIPEELATRELLHTGVEDMRVVDGMHERKATMAMLSDAFIAMPGGLGTLEEFFEVTTWAQLRFHNKPIGLLNTNQFFTPLMLFIEKAIELGFIKPQHRELIVMENTVEKLVQKLTQMKSSQSENN